MQNEFSSGIYVSADSIVEDGARIFAPAYISGGSHILSGARIMPFSHIENSYVGEGTVVYSSTLIGAHVEKNCTIGPYAYLRCGATVGERCRIGDFVEIKASDIGPGTKAAHHAYIGDAVVGENVNIGCGVVFCNYNGRTKSKSVVEDGVFIGANSNLVAPLLIKRGAYIAAGTTVTCDLADGDLCIGRQREKVLRGGAAGRYENG